MEKSTGDSNIDWEEVLVMLNAFTRSLIKHKPWFRGGSTDTFLKGKEVKDYVYEAIGRYLKNPEKYHPSRGNLIDYLKYNILRTLVGNDLRSEENKVSVDVFKYSNEDGLNDEGTPYFDSLLPCIEPLFADDIDFITIKEFIEKEISGETVLEEIFLGLYTMGMKRREIIKEFGMSDKEYNNGNRRLETILNRASSHFNVNKQTA